MDEIDKLESKLIKKKDWQLMGEVSSKNRPVNSLLEHNLEFTFTKRLDQTQES